MHVGHSLKGVEEHQLRGCVDDFVVKIEELLKRYVAASLSNDKDQRVQALTVLEVIVDGLRDDVNELLDERIDELKSMA